MHATVQTPPQTYAERAYDILREMREVFYSRFGFVGVEMSIRKAVVGQEDGDCKDLIVLVAEVAGTTESETVEAMEAAFNLLATHRDAEIAQDITIEVR